MKLIRIRNTDKKKLLLLIYILYYNIVYLTVELDSLPGKYAEWDPDISTMSTQK